MTSLATTALIIGQVLTIVGGIGLVIGVFKKIHDIFDKIHAIWDGQQCQLRNDITSIYYQHIDDDRPTLREYERVNLDDLYEGYKALGGNTYVDDIYKVMRGWAVKD